MVRVSRQGSERQNKMLLWALSYCVENRIPLTYLDNDIRKHAVEIPIEKFLPSQDDCREIRNRMNLVVARILVQEIPFFQRHFSECVPKHIRHRFWRESSKKSNVVNIFIYISKSWVFLEEWICVQTFFTNEIYRFQRGLKRYNGLMNLRTTGTSD